MYVSTCVDCPVFASLSSLIVSEAFVARVIIARAGEGSPVSEWYERYEYDGNKNSAVRLREAQPIQVVCAESAGIMWYRTADSTDVEQVVGFIVDSCIVVFSAAPLANTVLTMRSLHIMNTFRPTRHKMYRHSSAVPAI